MSWSYRADRIDEVYATVPGPALVNGDTTSNPPASAAAGNSVSVYATDGAIAVRSHTAVLTKGSAGAYTLAAPTVNGINIRVAAGTAFAHVVTATGLIDDGVTGGGKNTYTTAAFVGSGATFVSYNGHWLLMSKNLGSTA
jgi:hypothetical protein